MNTLFEAQLDLFNPKKDIIEITNWIADGDIAKHVNFHPKTYTKEYEVLIDGREEKKMQLIIQDSPSPMHYNRPPRLEISFVDGRKRGVRYANSVTIFKIGSMPYWGYDKMLEDIYSRIAWNKNYKFPPDLIQDMVDVVELFFAETKETVGDTI